MSDPIIEIDYIKWGIDLVQHDIRALSEKFEQGLIGGNTFEIKQGTEVIRMMKEYLMKDWETIKKYTQGKNAQSLYNAKIVPHSYLCKRLSAVACFRLDKQGATVALKRSLQILIDSDRIREIGKQELTIKFGTTQRAFVISDTNLLDKYLNRRLEIVSNILRLEASNLFCLENVLMLRCNYDKANLGTVLFYDRDLILTCYLLCRIYISHNMDFPFGNGA